jgi:virginiamycin B lyase
VTVAGAPAARPVIVTLHRADGAVSHSVLTDGAGAYRVPVVSPGRYLLEARELGTMSAPRETLDVAAGTIERDIALPGSSGARGVASSAAWLAALPRGEEKRRFLLDCTGCHQFDARIATPNGAPRTLAQWQEAVERMLRYAGASTGFPVISAAREPGPTAEWLERHVTASAAAGVRDTYPDPLLDRSAVITEFLLPEPQDLPHDVALDDSGRVVITGMMTHRMYVLDPATESLRIVPIPVPRANPRAVEIDGDGAWWVLLGAPRQLARYAPEREEWRTFDIGVYPHSTALARDGGVWFDGHFTRDPEVLGRVDPGSGAVRTFAAPKHPTLGDVPGGPIPYELRAAPDGRIWMSELQGNRLVALDPATGVFRTWTMPTPHSGPRRFDIDSAGILWIPAYAANALVRFDPGAERFTEIPLPLPDVVPYVARVDRRTGHVWIGTAAGDALLRYDPARERFTVYPLPSRGALVRHLAISDDGREIWLAYGASPGIPARVARVALP